MGKNIRWIHYQLMIKSPQHCLYTLQGNLIYWSLKSYHDDVIKWKYFLHYWPFVRGIYQSPVNSPHKGQWRGALMLSLICVWINAWVNDREAGASRCHHAHYDIVMATAGHPEWVGFHSRLSCDSGIRANSGCWYIILWELGIDCHVAMWHTQVLS